MKTIKLLTLISLLALPAAAFGQSPDAPSPASIAVTNPVTQKRIAGKADHLLAAIKLDDAAQAARAKAVMGEWFVAMWNWHRDHAAQLDELWSQWSQARSASPNDEFPGEVISRKIAAVYATLQPAYQTFTNQLAAVLSPEQVDAFKEAWSRKPGMTRTYKVYLEIVPGLTAAQQQVIHDLLLSAREAAMLTDDDREIVNLYKCQKIKVQTYIGALEWHRLYSDFVNRAKSH